MTPREPDRFDKQAQELCLTEWRRIAAALRAEHASALERAAQIVDTVNWPAKPLISARIRALIPPSAAPAAGRPFDPSAAPRKYAGPGYEFTVSDGGPMPAPAAETGKAPVAWKDYVGQPQPIDTLLRDAAADLRAFGDSPLVRDVEATRIALAARVASSEGEGKP